MPCGDRTGSNGKGSMTRRKMGGCRRSNLTVFGRISGFGRRLENQHSGMRRFNRGFEYTEQPIAEPKVNKMVENLKY